MTKNELRDICFRGTIRGILGLLSEFTVNKKNNLYKTLKQTKMNSAIYETRKHRFNQYKNTLRKSITEAKKRYFSNQFSR